MSSESEGNSTQDEVQFIEKVKPSVECIEITDESAEENSTRRSKKTRDNDEEDVIIVGEISHPLHSETQGSSSKSDDGTNPKIENAVEEVFKKAKDSKREEKGLLVDEASSSAPFHIDKDGTISSGGVSREDGKDTEEADGSGFIVIDQIGDVVDDDSGECQDEEPSVVFSTDFSDLFCLDTTPEASKDKRLGPRFRRVIIFLYIEIYLGDRLILKNIFPGV